MKNFRKIIRRVLIVILLLEIGFGLWYQWHRITLQKIEDKIAKAQSDIRILEKAVLKFKKKYNDLPLTLEYLTQGHNPVLQKLPQDPFRGPEPGRLTYYYFTSQNGHYVIYSCGPNEINDCDIDNYKEATRISRSLGSGEDPEDCDDIIISDLPIKDR